MSGFCAKKIKRSGGKKVTCGSWKTKGPVQHENIPEWASGSPDVIPIAALFGMGCEPNTEVDPRQALHSAELIFGVDVMSQRQFLVYGRDALQEIVTSGKAHPMQVLMIGLDQESDELEKLIALVRVIKGKDDYKKT